MDARRAAMAAAMGLLAGMGGGPRPGAGAAGASAVSSFDLSKPLMAARRFAGWAVARRGGGGGGFAAGGSGAVSYTHLTLPTKA